MQLRPPQQKLFDDTAEAHYRLAHENPGQKGNVMVVSPTGSGKTVGMSANIISLDAPQIAIAHRQELVGQISRALAFNGVRHGIIAPPNVVSAIRLDHLDKLGINYVDPNSHIRVAGVDTLLNLDPTDRWFQSVLASHTDEGHHILRLNKWGKAMLLFINARGTAYSATPLRADGQGLSRETDGLMDAMVEAPHMRAHIDMGYLTDYRLICEEVRDLDLSQVSLSKDGDFNKNKLSKAVHASREIVGDVVGSYLKYAKGKRGITFATDIEAAVELATAYNAAGVPAEVVTGKTPDALRRSILARLESGALLQVVNVDLFGEGTDVPAVEVISMARPTMSFALYSQQFGRALRLMIEKWLSDKWGTFTDEQRRGYIGASVKPWAIVIDHVGNWARHGLPDNVRRVWSLDRRASRRSALDVDTIGLRACTRREPQTCLRAYERHLTACPYCGFEPVPPARSGPKEVDGDVGEMDPEVLRVLRGQIGANHAPPATPFGATYQISAGIHNRHGTKLRELELLGHAIETWCAGRSFREPRPLSLREMQKAFYLVYGIDVMTAQTLDRASAAALRAKIDNQLLIDNIVSSAYSPGIN